MTNTIPAVDPAAETLDTKGEVVSICSSISEHQASFKSKASIYNVIFSGVALASDGYQSGVISFANLFLKQIYGSEVFNSTMASRLTYSLFVGEIIGQLGFGLIIDRIGRKFGLVSASLLVILGAALSAAASGLSPTGLLWMLIVARGLLGVGVGAEFPCSSVSAGEATDEIGKKRRGAIFVTVTQFVIDFGYVIAAVVTVILLAIFKDHLEPVWRLLLGLGILPPLSVLYFRLRMADSKQFQENALKKNVPYWLIFKRYWWRLTVTSVLWFLYDFISYPSSAFSSIVLETVAPDSTLMVNASWNILLYAFYLPGCVICALLVDVIGRRKTMAIGFLLQGIVGLVLGGAYYPLTNNCFPMFVVMYGAFQMSGEIGGGITGLISTESFPCAVRGTLYAIAAAIGKLGAVVGSLCYASMQDTMGGIRGPFLFGSALAIAMSIFAFFTVPEISPDSLDKEDEDFKQYLRENGYDTSNLGLQTEKPALQPANSN
ncbi:MFS general substrate transporter [Hesseltinella vesiculosa]|uniref:MFS general substrate transporter n=1 Tax=Hesseltinella vesiculosa TaxID=101127 RepID=A0A1X2GY94_9FUNG|nr:MFS general substrate transporter [Hesseltinella vesiculosa]